MHACILRSPERLSLHRLLVAAVLPRRSATGACNACDSRLAARMREHAQIAKMPDLQKIKNKWRDHRISAAAVIAQVAHRACALHLEMRWARVARGL